MTSHLWHRAPFTGTVTCADCGLLPLDDDDTRTLCPSAPGMTRYLLADGNLRTPASPYGHDTASCAPLAVAVQTILTGETGEPVTVDGLEHVMGLVVNGHPDPGYLMATYGPEYGYAPGDYLDNPGEYLDGGDQ